MRDLALIEPVHQIEQALGSPRKLPAAAEVGNRPVARRSVVAARSIACGEVFTAPMLACKRPGQGISPMDYWQLLGRAARRDYGLDEQIEP